MRRAPLLLLGVLAGCSSDGSAVVISEFLAANGSGLTDFDGDSSDWIELHNQGKAAVQLEGWCLTDDPREPQRWCFPSVSIPAQGFLLVFASGKQAPPHGEELHASFKLKGTEDYLGLLRPSGRVAYEFAPYPDQKQDVSYGASGSGPPGYLSRPTPGAPNSEALSSPALNARAP